MVADKRKIDMRLRWYAMTLIGALVMPSLNAQSVDYSVVSVPEEAGAEFVNISQPTDFVCMPEVKRSSRSLNWYTNKIIDISVDGNSIAYLSYRNNMTNIFVKDLRRQGTSVQKTNRQAVLDFSFTPDGKNIVYSEKRGKTNHIFLTPAGKGALNRQITSGNLDYSPIQSYDGSLIFFARQENSGVSIWSHDLKNNFLTSYSQGFNPCPVSGENAYVCVRTNGMGGNEIWKVNYETGVEECIVSSADHSFTTPSISPDGQWLLFVGSTKIEQPTFTYFNTDIFVCRMDGTDFTQLTYHAADDLSPVWSKDGQYIYFISQRGSSEAQANIWRMRFDLW